MHRPHVAKSLNSKIPRAPQARNTKSILQAKLYQIPTISTQHMKQHVTTAIPPTPEVQHNTSSVKSTNQPLTTKTQSQHTEKTSLPQTLNLQHHTKLLTAPNAYKTEIYGNLRKQQTNSYTLNPGATKHQYHNCTYKNCQNPTYATNPPTKASVNPAQPKVLQTKNTNPQTPQNPQGSMTPGTHKAATSTKTQNPLTQTDKIKSHFRIPATRNHSKSRQHPKAHHNSQSHSIPSINKLSLYTKSWRVHKSHNGNLCTRLQHSQPYSLASTTSQQLANPWYSHHPSIRQTQLTEIHPKTSLTNFAQHNQHPLPFLNPCNGTNQAFAKTLRGTRNHKSKRSTTRIIPSNVKYTKAHPRRCNHHNAPQINKTLKRPHTPSKSNTHAVTRNMRYSVNVSQITPYHKISFTNTQRQQTQTSKQHATPSNHQCKCKNQHKTTNQSTSKFTTIRCTTIRSTTNTKQHVPVTPINHNTARPNLATIKQQNQPITGPKNSIQATPAHSVYSTKLVMPVTPITIRIPTPHNHPVSIPFHTFTNKPQNQNRNKKLRQTRDPPKYQPGFSKPTPVINHNHHTIRAYVNVTIFEAQLRTINPNTTTGSRTINHSHAANQCKPQRIQHTKNLTKYQLQALNDLKPNKSAPTQSTQNSRNNINNEIQ
eukprot:gene3239-2221_t